MCALGLQINNMGLCFHLNTLTVSMKELSIISGNRASVATNPGFRKQAMAFAGLKLMKIVAVGMIGMI